MSSLLPFAVSEINENSPDNLYHIIQNELMRFSKEYPEIGDVFVSTEDGFEVATNTAKEIPEHIHKLAAMTSSMIGLGNAMLNETKGGLQHALTLEGENGNIIFNQIRTEQLILCFTAIADINVPLGQLFWLQRQVAGTIKNLCDSSLNMVKLDGGENE